MEVEAAIPIPSPVTNPVLSDYLKNLLMTKGGIGFLAVFIPNLITLFLIAGALAFLFIFLVGGMQFILSGGDKVKLEEARGRITSAIIGLVLIFSLFAIMKLLGYFFGLNLLKIDFGPLKL